MVWVWILTWGNHKVALYWLLWFCFCCYVLLWMFSIFIRWRRVYICFLFWPESLSNLVNEPRLMRCTIILFNDSIEWLRGMLTAAIFDRSGRYVITGSDDRLVKIWSMETAYCLASCRGHEVSCCYSYLDPSLDLPSFEFTCSAFRVISLT